MLDSIPKILRDRYRFEEREHACSILAGDFASEWKDLLDCLKAFTLRKGYITKGGGGRSDIPQTLDGFLKERGWSKKRSLGVAGRVRRLGHRQEVRLVNHALGQAYSQSKRWRLVDARCCSLG